MRDAAVAKALKAIGQGFLDLAATLANEVDDHTAMKEQKAVVDTRAGRAPADEGDGRVVNIRATKETPVTYPEKALKALGKLDLAEATRPELKEVAEALGVYQQGQKATELREVLSGIAKQQGKGGKKAAPADDDEEAEEPTYPDAKTMKKEFKLFCKVNRAAIEEEQPEFFDEDDDSDNPEERLHQIVADEDLLKTAWRDNVWDTKQRGEWDEMVREAEAQVG